MNISTPGVYVQELNTLPPSVAGVSTAIPAFVGFTEARHDDPVPQVQRIISMLEYEQHFGGAFDAVTHNVTMTSGTVIGSVSTNVQAYMYQSLAHYFQNGGGPCYIVSVGSYDDFSTTNATDSEIRDLLVIGIESLAQVDEVTLLSMPDALIRRDGTPALSDEGNGDDALFGDVMDAAIAQCESLKDRFCIFDVLRGTEAPGPGITSHDDNTNTDGFRSRAKSTNYAAAYYPWLRSSTAATLRYNQLSFDTPPDDVNGLNQAVTDAFTDMDDVCQSTEPAFVRSSPKGTVDDLRTIFNDLCTTALDAGTAGSLRRAVRFIVSLGTALEEADDPTSPLSNLLNGMKSDSKLIEAIVAAVGYANHLATLPTPLINSFAGSYDNLDNTAWIVVQPGPTPVYELTADIGGANYSSGFVPVITDPQTDQRRAAIHYLRNSGEVDINKLFSAYAALFQAAEYNYNLAESRLFDQHPIFASLKEQLEEESRFVPAQGAVAGVYAATDRNRGVWKAPANVFLSGVTGPAVRISNEQQDLLNVDPDTGKSINAIRVFSGQGTVVWGARTLLGNDNEWRYVNVRRFFIFAEESIQKASGAFVFEPNNANTWIKVKTMIMNFLINQWRAGALLGDKAEDAFYVNVGLGETMTPQDVLEGKMIVEVGMAAVRPAEFIVLRFTHSMPQ